MLVKVTGVKAWIRKRQMLITETENSIRDTELKKNNEVW
jgi:Fe-S cluster biosynthesis and repair protein YggX